MSDLNGVNGQGNPPPVPEDWETEAMESVENPDQDVEGSEEAGDDWGDSSYVGAEGEGRSTPQTSEEAQKLLNEMRQMLVDKLRSKIPEAEKKTIREQIKKIDAISLPGNGPLDPETANQISALTAEVYGGAGDGTEEGADKPLDQQMTDFVTAHPQLADEKKQQLEKLIAAVRLDPAAEGMAVEKFGQMQEEAVNLTLYSEDIVRTAQAIGSDEAAVEALFKKHGIEKLSVPPGPAEQALFSDPEFIQSTNLQTTKDAVVEAETARKDADKAADEEIRTYNTTMSTPDRPSSYQVQLPKGVQTKSELKLGKGEVMEKWKNAQKAHAQEFASLYSKMSGVPCTADSANAGMVIFGGSADPSIGSATGGTSLNVVGDVSSNLLEFKDKPNPPPEVTLQTLNVDQEGDGQSDITPLMMEAGYANHLQNLDSGGSILSYVLGSIFMAPVSIAAIDDATDD